MHRKIAMAIMAVLLGGCVVLTSLPVLAQQYQQQQQNKGKGQSGGGGNAGAPHGGARTVTPGTTHTSSPSATRTVTPRATRTVTPRATRTATPTVIHAVTPRATRTVTPSATHTATPRVTRTVTPAATRKVTTPTTATRKVATPATASRKVTTPTTAIRKVTPGAAPKVAAPVAPSGGKAHVVTAGKLRGVPASGAGRATILGHNYSVWRSGYRVRHGNGWLTFVALRTITAIAIGSRHYYPYAYITAPQPYCTGLTEDGCQLMWQDVETIEGDVVSQCVAYCPWQ